MKGAAIVIRPFYYVAPPMIRLIYSDLHLLWITVTRDLFIRTRKAEVSWKNLSSPFRENMACNQYRRDHQS